MGFQEDSRDMNTHLKLSELIFLARMSVPWQVLHIRVAVAVLPENTDTGLPGMFSGPGFQNRTTMG